MRAANTVRLQQEVRGDTQRITLQTRSQWLSSWKLFDERQRSPKEIRLGCDSDGIGLLLMDDFPVGDSLTAFMALFINLNYKLLFFLEPQDPVRKTRMRGADEDVGGGGGARAG